MAHAPAKVLIATFASHVHRIRQVIDLSQKQGRAVSIVGKSLVGNIEVARETGHLRIAPEVLVDVSKITDRDPKTVTLLTTGSQGEPLSALARIATGDHPHVKLGPGDTVIMSSRIIPGNERTIARLLDHLYSVCPCVWPCQPGRVAIDDESGPASVFRPDSWGVSPPGPTLCLGA
jgi:ribonuclease J